MRITEDEHDDRRNHMIHVAYTLYCKYGIDYATVERIAKAAGLSRNSIFRYFGTKADLVECTQIILWQEIVSHILENNKEQINHAENGWGKVRILLSGFKDLYENHAQYLLFACDYKLFLVRNNIVLSELKHRKMLSPVYSVFSDAIKLGQQDGSITKNESIESHFFAMWGILRGFVEEIVVYDKMYEGKNPWKDKFDSVLDLIMNNLSP